jgi:DNA-binding transcriptional LysR family regulator
MASLTVAFEERLPAAHWGPLFHVLRLERPELRLEWRAAPFPTLDRSLLEGADVGLFVAPPEEEGLQALTLTTSPMVVVMAAGHRLARSHELRVADILDERFPGCAGLHPQWRAFWTLTLNVERRRGARMTPCVTREAVSRSSPTVARSRRFPRPSRAVCPTPGSSRSHSWTDLLFPRDWCGVPRTPIRRCGRSSTWPGR